MNLKVFGPQLERNLSKTSHFLEMTTAELKCWVSMKHFDQGWTLRFFDQLFLQRPITSVHGQRNATTFTSLKSIVREKV